MTEREFWNLIASINASLLDQGHDREAVNPLITMLSTKPAADIKSFEDHLHQRLAALDTERHGEAADVAGASDDAFLYLRCYVVAKGREYYKSVVEDAEKMPDDFDCWCEPLLSVAEQAWNSSQKREWSYTPAKSKMRRLQLIALSSNQDIKFSREFNAQGNHMAALYFEALPKPCPFPFVKINVDLNIDDSKHDEIETPLDIVTVNLWPFRVSKYYRLSTDKKKKLLLEKVHEGCVKVAQHFGCDTTSFETARNRVVEGAYVRTREVHPVVKSPGGGMSCQCLGEIDIDEYRLNAVIRRADGAPIKTVTILRTRRDHEFLHPRRDVDDVDPWASKAPVWDGDDFIDIFLPRDQFFARIAARR
ncbi:MAG: DUF4240 domain-containing protein [Phycisphaera sp.]|nr:DUF4240 domain-containing protein [Phycisphaera sp.]